MNAVRAASWPQVSVLHHHPPNEQLSNQKQMMTARTRLNVTTCLCLSPNNSARSLSTFIAVDDQIDTVQKI